MGNRAIALAGGAAAVAAGCCSHAGLAQELKVRLKGLAAAGGRALLVRGASEGARAVTGIFSNLLLVIYRSKRHTTAVQVSVGK